MHATALGGRAAPPAACTALHQQQVPRWERVELPTKNRQKAAAGKGKIRATGVFVSSMKRRGQKKKKGEKNGFGISLRDGLINKREEFGRVAMISSLAMKCVNTWARWSDPKMLWDLKMNVAKEVLSTVAYFLHCNGNPHSFPLTRVT